MPINWVENQQLAHDHGGLLFNMFFCTETPAYYAGDCAFNTSGGVLK